MPLSQAFAVRTATANGIAIPEIIWETTRETGISFAVGCSLVEQESYGGQNVWGGDGGENGFFSHYTNPDGTKTVTEEAYAAYKWHRKKGFGQQGVGPCQLTYWSIQDRADELGGCWLPTPNCLTGFELLRHYRDANESWHPCFVRYNGSGQQAIDYADRMMLRLQKWRNLLHD